MAPAPNLNISLALSYAIRLRSIPRRSRHVAPKTAAVSPPRRRPSVALRPPAASLCGDHAGDWLNAMPTTAYLRSDKFLVGIQRRYGLHVSAARPYYDAQAAAGYDGAVYPRPSLPAKIAIPMLYAHDPGNLRFPKL